MGKKTGSLQVIKAGIAIWGSQTSEKSIAPGGLGDYQAVSSMQGVQSFNGSEYWYEELEPVLAW